MVARMSETIPVEKQTLDELSEENHLLKQLIKELNVELETSRQEISYLKEQIATLNRRLYGKKSERFKQSVESDAADVTLTPEEQKLLDEAEEVGDANIKRDVFNIMRHLNVKLS